MKFERGDVVVKPYGNREIVLVMLRPTRQKVEWLNMGHRSIVSNYWFAPNALPEKWRYVGRMPAYWVNYFVGTIPPREELPVA